MSKDKAAFTASIAGACTCGHDHGHSHSHDHHHHDHGCSCGHDHEHGDGCGCGHDHGVVREDSKSFVIRLLIAFGIVVAANLVPIKLVSIALFLVAYILAGYEVLGAMFRGIRKGNFMDENFLMGIASVGAFAIGEYTEAVAVLIFYGIGELCQNIAIARSRGNIASLMDIRPDYANLLKNGETITVSPESVHIGSIILVKPGEKIPLDGIIRKGSSSLDTSALTGESLPRDVAEGDKVLSGSINKSGLLEVETTSTFGDSTVSKILEMVEHASSNKAESEKFITKFAKIYTPAVVYSAIAVAVIPPIIFGFDTFTTWFYRALNFLIISCPCALVISIPMSFFGGIGGAARNGVLVKGGNYLEALNGVTTFVFDKTGTLTEGKFSVSSVNPNGVSEDEVVKNAAICEKHSNHPIAVSIREYYGDKEIEDYAIEEIAGQGIKATKGEDVLLSGNIKLMESFGIKAQEVRDGTTVVYVAKNGKFLGSVSISDNLKKETKEALKDLKAEGVNNLVMLTGDRAEVAEIIAKEIGITDYKAELMPQDKVTVVEEILKNSKGKTVFVGDGINDAPVLARADIGMAMGGIGSDAAIEAADIVIMNDDLKKLPLALRCAKKTRSVVMQNIVFALGTKALILILSVFGITSIWFAIFADVGVALIAILNATRALKVK